LRPFSTRHIPLLDPLLPREEQLEVLAEEEEEGEDEDEEVFDGVEVEEGGEGTM
tara:strand:- start:1778 stop:1939 length:162 start_codon:yes stop_codon:yes gene_type:complete